MLSVELSVELAPVAPTSVGHPAVMLADQSEVPLTPEVELESVELESELTSGYEASEALDEDPEHWLEGDGIVPLVMGAVPLVIGILPLVMGAVSLVLGSESPDDGISLSGAGVVALPEPSGESEVVLVSEGPPGVRASSVGLWVSGVSASGPVVPLLGGCSASTTGVSDGWPAGVVGT